MANTHGESSMEEFAAKALPELEELLERFKDQNKPDEPEPEPDDANATQEPDDDTRNTDKERIEELAHIIWHLANHMEEIAFHEGGLCSKLIVDIQNVRRQVADINDFLNGFDDEPRF